MERFLRNRDKVKVTIMFRGREMTHPERGRDLLLRLAEDVKELGVIESQPLQDGRNMVMMLGPVKAAPVLPAKQAEAEPARAASRRQPEPAESAPAAADASVRSKTMPKMKTSSGAKKRFRSPPAAS